MVDETSITSSDSGVVSRQSGGSRTIPASGRRYDVSVPERRTPSQQRAIAREPDVQVVQERLDRTDVEDAQPPPALGEHARHRRKEGASVFPPRWVPG